MATDKVHPGTSCSSPPRPPEGGRLAAEGRRLSDAGRLAGQARAGRRAIPRTSGWPRAGTRLWVQGTRRDVRLQECLDCHRLEIDYSRFERLLELPGLSESAEIGVSCRDGMLLIRIQTEAPR